jgi:hypothetical protein
MRHVSPQFLVLLRVKSIFGKLRCLRCAEIMPVIMRSTARLFCKALSEGISSGVWEREKEVILT